MTKRNPTHRICGFPNVRGSSEVQLSEETLQKDSAVQYLQRLARQINSMALAQVPEYATGRLARNGV